MQITSAEKTSSQSPWDTWCVKGVLKSATHGRPQPQPWSMTILVEQDGRDIEIEEVEGLTEEEAHEAITAWQVWLG